MNFGDTAAALADQARQQSGSSVTTLIDSAEVGNDEGDDIFVLIYSVYTPGMPDLSIDSYTSVRWAIYGRKSDTALASGIVR